MADYDVAVAGGGPAGAATALILAKSGWRVLLADMSDTEAFRVGEGFAPVGHSLLRDLGVLERFLADQHRTSYGTVSAWGSDELQASDFIFNLQGRGYQLDRARFDAMLRHAALEAGVKVHEGMRLEPILDEVKSGKIGFCLRSDKPSREEHFESQWLVDATGRPASLARGFGAKRIAQDRQLAFWTLLDSTKIGDCDGRTLVESRPDGWWYSVLLPSGKRLAAFLTDADLADRPALLCSNKFRDKLDETIHLRQLCMDRGYVVSQKPRGADASSARLNPLVGPSWLVVGDAAISFDPLSSQGILNALHTGIRAGKALDAAMRGNISALAEYAEHLEKIYATYLGNRSTYYAYERRWLDKQFWARRQP